MAFESLSSRLQESLKKVRGQSTLTEENMEDMLREIRLALLEADVNFTVAKEFIADVKEKAIGQDVIGSLKPGQVLVKIVHDELVELLGGEVATLDLSHTPTVIMMVGLQGSGKTTSAAKISKYLVDKQSKKPLMIAADIYRPAAVEQLKTLGQQLNIDVFEKGTDLSAEEIVQEGMNYGLSHGHDVIIIDTAGRLHIDEPLMQELSNIKEIAKPHEILLVVDALTGQDIVNVASSFNEQLTITGAVLTKLDGDARGGGALSIRHITHVPIKFIGTGEKLDALDLFYPDRMADRILGMGDVVSLVEKVQDVYDEEESRDAYKRLKKGTFGLDDMLDQLHQIQKLGPLSGVMKMMPGMNNIPDIDDAKTDETLKITESIIYSMTPEERRNPSIINPKRKQRIAKGSGRTVADVNRLLKQFEQTLKMMKQMDSIDPNTGRKKQNNTYNPNRKKVRHKKKKRR